MSARICTIVLCQAWFCGVEHDTDALVAGVTPKHARTQNTLRTLSMRATAGIAECANLFLRMHLLRVLCDSALARYLPELSG